MASMKMVAFKKKTFDSSRRNGAVGHTGIRRCVINLFFITNTSFNKNLFVYVRHITKVDPVARNTPVSIDLDKSPEFVFIGFVFEFDECSY